MKERDEHSTVSYYFRCGNEPIIIALLNRGASLEQVDNTGLTALHHAVNSGQVGEMCHSLLLSILRLV